MLGYHAWTEDPTTNPDGEEIAEVRWLSRDELRTACQSGEVRLPPRISIARMLIERWFGEPIPSEWGRN
jgi:NAD+ diphosphatase